MKFHITIHPSQFLVQRTLCILQLYLESLRKRFTTESNELSLDCQLMKRKYATQSGNLNSTTQKKLAKRMVELSTLLKNNFVKILKWADH